MTLRVRASRKLAEYIQQASRAALLNTFDWPRRDQTSKILSEPLILQDSAVVQYNVHIVNATPNSDTWTRCSPVTRSNCALFNVSTLNDVA